MSIDKGDLESTAKAFEFCEKLYNRTYPEFTDTNTQAGKLRGIVALALEQEENSIVISPTTITGINQKFSNIQTTFKTVLPTQKQLVEGRDFLKHFDNVLGENELAYLKRLDPEGKLYNKVVKGDETRIKDLAKLESNVDNVTSMIGTSSKIELTLSDLMKRYNTKVNYKPEALITPSKKKCRE